MLFSQEPQKENYKDLVMKPPRDETSDAVAIEENIRPTLHRLVDQTVIVSVTSVGIYRSGFHTQISIQGQLEKHPAEESYRVLVSDSSYCYFDLEDVYLVSPKQECGPVIFLRIHHVDDGSMALTREYKEAYPHEAIG